VGIREDDKGNMDAVRIRQGYWLFRFDVLTRRSDLGLGRDKEASTKSRLEARRGEKRKEKRSLSRHIVAYTFGFRG